jgi:putative phosphoribosyl transferase
MSRLSAVFADRTAAGFELAESVALVGPARPLVVAVPLAGVEVAAPVATRLGCRLSMAPVRRITTVGDDVRVRSFGAVGPEGVAALDESAVCELSLSERYVERAVARSSAALEGWMGRWRGSTDWMAEDLGGVDVVIVDDLANDAHALAAAADLARARGARSITAAVPAATAEAANMLELSVDRLVCLLTENRPLDPADCFAAAEPPTERTVNRWLRESAGRFG